MEQSTTNIGMNGSHLQNQNQNQNDNPPSYTFLNGIDLFAASDNPPSNSAAHEFNWDPELFATAEEFTQPSHPLASAYNQHASRQSDSPALPQYNPQQNAFTHSQYSQPLYQSRPHSTQPSFDPQYLNRPSPSPGPFEQYNYHSNIHHPAQGYNLGSLPQRQASATPQTYPQRQSQPYHPYMNFSARPSQLPPPHTTDSFFNSFEQHQQQPTNNYVNPSLLTANDVGHLNGNQPNFQQRQQFSPSPYFSKAGSTGKTRI